MRYALSMLLCSAVVGELCSDLEPSICNVTSRSTPNTCTIMYIQYTHVGEELICAKGVLLDFRTTDKTEWTTQHTPGTPTCISYSHPHSFP